MSKFEKTWSGKGSKFTDKVREVLQPKTKIRERLETAIRQLELQNRKLDVALMSLKEKDKHYYNRILDALRMRDRNRAILYANELAEVRKALRSVHQAKLAIEQIALRLSTVKELGDIIVTLVPAVSVIRSIRGSLSEVLPQADEEFATISNMLSNILVDAGQIGGFTIDFTTANEEAEKILKEAEEQVEREMKEKLPSVPTLEMEKDKLKF